MSPVLHSVHILAGHRGSVSTFHQQCSALFREALCRTDEQNGPNCVIASPNISESMSFLKEGSISERILGILLLVKPIPQIASQSFKFCWICHHLLARMETWWAKLVKLFNQMNTRPPNAKIPSNCFSKRIPPSLQ